MANTPNAAINIWRKADDPSVVWRMLKADRVTPSDLPEGFELDVYWPGQNTPMTYTTDGVGAVMSITRTTGEVVWNYTVQDSFRIPLGAKATYELFGLSSGRRKFWVGGTVNVGSYRQ